MIESYRKVLEVLKTSTKRTVLVTIPPVQYLADSIRHWRTFEGFNDFILQQHDGIYIILQKNKFAV